MIKHTLSILAGIFILALLIVVGGAYILRQQQLVLESHLQELVTQKEHLEYSLQTLENQVQTLIERPQTTSTEQPTIPTTNTTITTPPTLATRASTDPLCSVPVDGTSFPIAPEYAHLDSLGKVFTALSCGTTQVEQLQEVENKRYIAGLQLQLQEAPDAELLNMFKRLGLSCTETGAAIRCKQWQLQTPLSVEALIKLEPYSTKFSSASCLYCGTTQNQESVIDTPEEETVSL